jgi:hypothetical protein
MALSMISTCRWMYLVTKDGGSSAGHIGCLSTNDALISKLPDDTQNGHAQLSPEKTR